MNDNDDAVVDQELANTLADSLSSSSARGAALVRQHSDDYGEVLSHILAADVARWYSGTDMGSDPTVARDADAAVVVLADLLVRGNDDMKNVVVTGFLEALPQPGEAGRETVERLPAPLREELQRMDDWRPD